MLSQGWQACVSPRASATDEPSTHPQRLEREVQWAGCHRLSVERVCLLLPLL